MSKAQWQRLPFYIFFIIRPDGNSAYYKMHQQYPLTISIDQFLGLISLSFSMNNLQTKVVPEQISSNRKQQLDLSHKNFVKSLVTSTFQMRCYDSISGYRFVLMVDGHTDARKVDAKLQQIYKMFVNYVIKAPFFNVHGLSFLERTDNLKSDLQNEERLNPIQVTNNNQKWNYRLPVYKVNLICNNLQLSLVEVKC